MREGFGADATLKDRPPREKINDRSRHLPPDANSPPIEDAFSEMQKWQLLTC